MLSLVLALATLPEPALLLLADGAPATVQSARRAVRAAGGWPLVARGPSLLCRLPAGAQIPAARVVRGAAAADLLALPPGDPIHGPVLEAPPAWIPDPRPRPGLGTFTNPNANTLHGSTAVHVFYLESTGAEDQLTWTPEALAEASHQASAALAWWADTAARHGVSAFFEQHDHVGAEAEVDFEPILAGDLETAGQEAAMQVLERQGFTSGSWSTRAYAFNEQTRAARSTDNASLAFVIYNPPPAPTTRAFAFRGAGALFAPMYGLMELRLVFAHETGHIYGACDEYGKNGGFGACEAGSCDTCDISSVEVTNSNCSGCSDLLPPCVMRFNTPKVCWVTRAQIGWPWNNPPSAPATVGPAHGSLLYDDEVEFTTSGGSDADTDPLRYRFWLRSAATGESTDTESVAAGADGVAHYRPPTMLAPGKYNLAALADDGKDTGPQTEAILFTVRARPAPPPEPEPPPPAGSGGDAAGCGCAGAAPLLPLLALRRRRDPV